MRTYSFPAVMAVVLALTGFSGSAIADESFGISGTGDIGSEYEIVITIDGANLTWANGDNQQVTPASFVAEWKSHWDALHPTLTHRFVDNEDGTFELIGDDISVEVGDIGDTHEVVGDPDGVPFNPTLLWTGGTPIPTVSEWGLIVMTLLLLTAGTVVFGRRRRPAAA